MYSLRVHNIALEELVISDIYLSEKRTVNDLDITLPGLENVISQKKKKKKKCFDRRNSLEL